MEGDVEQRLVRKICMRILPLLILGYFFSYFDRVNVGFAAISMKEDFHLSPAAFGFGAGIFFIGYTLFEIPSNLIMLRTGPRIWIGRIMITWGLISAGTAFVWNDVSFWVARFLLGVAEAGFFPGIIYYLTLWLPARYRARIFGLVLATGVVSVVIGSPISGWILSVGSIAGLKNWQWLLIVEGLPSSLLGIIVLFGLPNRPDQVTWLSAREKTWLTQELQQEKSSLSAEASRAGRALLDRRVWALGLMVFPLAAAIYGMFTWLPQVVSSLGASPMQTGLINAVPFIFSAIAMVWWGNHSDRTGERAWHLIIPPVCATVGLVTAAMLPVGIWTLVWLSIGMAGTLAALTMIVSVTPEFLTGAAAAAGIALVNAIGNVGSFCGPYLIGLIKAMGGQFQTALLALGLLLLVTVGLAVWFRARHGVELGISSANA
ncbi:MFS transporter [Burkholderia sp. JKS000303]|uniref:MFS transporter n=1 Tax=Burkholderia sp. JKS000303 TaxID=1938747 RepID=UPI000BF59819|nr:MFS transporter [Burkholderia sp. JKS000303]PFH19011.1 ACS family tartrate transporter-like MFS transporter [Burkholderia sp. JKS000303]